MPHILARGQFIGAFGYLVQGFGELTFTDITLPDYSFIGLLAIVTISESRFGLAFGV